MLTLPVLLAPVLLVLLLKIYLVATEGVCRSRRNLEGKTAIVTGANIGIGLETARELARRKARVILACRNTEKANAAARDITRTSGNRDVVVCRLDLSSFASIREFAKKITETESRLDILIHNAAHYPLERKQMTEDNLEMTFATNHFGPFLLNHLLLDLLKRSAPARIIVVSSTAHIIGKIDFDNLNSEKYLRTPFWLYSDTKLANVLFVLELSERLKGTDVTVNAVHPGAVRTSLFRDASWIVRYIIRPLTYFFMKATRSGAQTSIYAAVSDELEGVSGKYFSDCRRMWTSPKARDRRLAAKLWEVSERITGVRPD